MVMLHRLSNFEIDEAKRELRAGRHVVAPQRRIFDLLVYLARHADRVVPKDELLEAVWPGVMVTDNSLQRAVSVARVVLKKAGCAAAIRTHPRQGYRLCAPEPELVSPPVESEQREPLRLARAAFARGEWDCAMDALQELEPLDALGADELRFWFHVAQCAGRTAEALSPLERAVTAFHRARDSDRAACAAILLAQLRLDAREPALAKGWLRRASRQLEGQPEGREHGYLSFALCRLALFENDLDAAVRMADSAREIGERSEDPDLQALGLLYGGEARLYRGDVEEGLAAIDEAGVAVVALSLSPWVGGLIYCGIIFSSLTRADWHRAAQWNHQFDRWCEVNGAPGAVGLCRLHRAEVLCVEGNLTAAEHEARGAQEALRRNAPWAEGDAWRVLGEIQLARGDWSQARESMSRAHEYGWNAQLGLALLEHARGRTTQAHRLLGRALRDPHWSNRARRGVLLAHFAEISARAGCLHDAREALREIDARPELVSTSALEALVTRARGELAAAEGKRTQAIDLMQTALQRWKAIEAPLMAAQSRCRLAELLRAEGDAQSAELELAAAQSAFQKSGAFGLLSECARSDKGRRHPPPPRIAAPGNTVMKS
jgi:DNA-binding winged helix-turn-helix (wHTH) protein